MNLISFENMSHEIIYGYIADQSVKAFIVMS